MLTVKSTGTQTAVVGTEHTLLTSTDAGIFQIAVDLYDMVDADEVELRVYVKTLTGDANPKLAYYANFIHKQGNGNEPGNATISAGEVIKDSPPVTSPYEVTFTLKQVAGTAADFPWRVVTF